MYAISSLALALLGSTMASPVCLARDPSALSPIDIEYNSASGEYYTTFSVGDTDNIPAFIDTGSSMWWFSSTYYNASPDLKSTNKTTTLLYTAATLSADLYTGPVGFGSFLVDDFTFAVVASQSTSLSGIIGLGLPGGESTVSSSSYSNGKLTSDYTDTYITRLKNSGAIATAMYSLWINDVNIGRGQLLFGGIDFAKFSGTLGRIPLLTTPAIDLATMESYHPTQPWQYAIALNSVSLVNSDNESGQVISDANLPVLLDSGSTYSLVSPKFASAIVDTLKSTSTPLVYNEQYNMYLTTSVPQGNFVFDFSGVTISCPFSDFFADAGTQNGVAVSALTLILNLNANATNVSSPASITVFGQNFLSSAYVVYDEEHTEVALAQANRGQLFDTSNIVKINGDLPSATKAPRYGETQVSGDYEVHYFEGLF